MCWAGKHVGIDRHQQHTWTGAPGKGEEDADRAERAVAVVDWSFSGSEKVS